jgi:hypothetical protein
MHVQRYIPRPPRGKKCGEAIRLLPEAPAPLRVHRDAEIMVDTGPGWLVRWHLAGGPWSAQAPVAIGALRGFHHAKLAPGATWPTAIVVTLGSALLLVGGSELVIGQIVIAWPVVAAALGVLVIGFGALWLASRETVRPSDH